MAQKQNPVEYFKIISSNFDDNTNNFRLFIEDKIREAGETARPALLDMSFIHIDKNGEEVILSLADIPIVPPIFDPNPNPKDGYREKNYNDFLFKPRTLNEIRDNPKGWGFRSAEDIKKTYSQLSPEFREEYIKVSADLIISYILGQIGMKYHEQNDQLDSDVPHRLKDFQILKDENFDLDFFDLAIRTSGLKEKDGGLVAEVEENGKTITVEFLPEEIEAYKEHQKKIKHCWDEGGYFVKKFADDVRAFERNEIQKSASAPGQFGE